jgi:hypothetical protein
MPLVMWAMASTTLSPDDLLFHNDVIITVCTITGRSATSAVISGYCHIILSPVGSDFPDITAIVVLIISSRLWSSNLLYLSTAGNLEALLFTRDDNRGWRSGFLHDDLLRLRRPLTDDDGLRGRFRAIIVFGLSLISLHLVWFFAALSFLNPDISLPNVPFRVPRSTVAVVVPILRFARAIPFPLVVINYCSGVVMLGFTRLALNISLDDGGSWAEVDSGARAFGFREAFDSTINLDALPSR